MINAGISFNIVDTFNNISNTWPVNVTVTYPLDSSQNVSTNPISINDLIIDFSGGIWKIVTSPVRIGTTLNYNVDLQLVYGDSLIITEPLPGIRYAVTTPNSSGQISPYWNNSYVHSYTLSIASQYNNSFSLASTSSLNLKQDKIEWVIISSSHSAVINDYILADTSIAGFTITLPSNPISGSQVHIADAKGTFATNNVTVDGNGLNIFGGIAPFVLDVNNSSIYLVYLDSAYGWTLAN